jgi:hypothetical protein
MTKISNSNKKYTVADLYKEAGKMLTSEMQEMKNGKELSKVEKTKMDEMAKILSNSILKDMGIKV